MSIQMRGWPQQNSADRPSTASPVQQLTRPPTLQLPPGLPAASTCAGRWMQTTSARSAAAKAVWRRRRRLPPLVPPLRAGSGEWNCTFLCSQRTRSSTLEMNKSNRRGVQLPGGAR